MNLTEKAQKRLHIIYGTVLSALLIITGILFAVSCYNVYKSGYQPFTRESIGAAFKKISAPVYVTVVAILGGIVLNIVFPTETKKLKGTRSPSVILAGLARKVNYSKLDVEVKEKIEKERRLRKILSIVNTVLFVLEGTLPLIYLLNPNNFPAKSGEYNSEILHGMVFYTVCLLPLLIYEVVYVILTDRSRRVEISYLQDAVKRYGVSDSEPTECECKCVLSRISSFFKKNEKQIVLGARIALVGCAVVFIILGIANGGMADVLIKAINICTECIGLG